MYIVKDIAKKFDLTPYTDLGLISPVKRDKNNNRLFGEDSFEWFVTIIHLKRCGMTMNDIKKYVDLCEKGNSTLQERYDYLMKYKEYADEQLKDAKIQAEFMKNKLDTYERWIEEDSQKKHLC